MSEEAYRVLLWRAVRGEISDITRDYRNPQSLENRLNTLAGQGYCISQPPQFSGENVLIIMEKVPEGGPDTPERRAAEQDLTGPITIQIKTGINGDPAQVASAIREVLENIERRRSQ